MKINTALAALNAKRDQCQKRNSSDVCRSTSTECTAAPSTNRIVLRGQKYSIEKTPSHTIISKLATTHQRTDGMRQLASTATTPSTTLAMPNGRKYWAGPITDINWSAIPNR